MGLRHLVLVLGDQLWFDNPALAGIDPQQDRVLMIEAPGEASSVWSHKARIALFLSAMRHFCNEVHRRRWPYTYWALDQPCPLPGADALSTSGLLSFSERLVHVLRALQPQKLLMCEAGDWALAQGIEAAAAATQVPLEALPDSHFLCSRDEFAAWARGRRELRMEFFYRDMRRRHGVLMQGQGKAAQPWGGKWNFDADNRKGYPASGPGDIPPPAFFEPDRTTQDVLALVERYFPQHPGSLAHFGWPVTRAQALEALQRFVAERLPRFGPQQDAMWTDTPWGWHALLSPALNLHLLDPREVVAAAEAAFHAQGLDLPGVEGFIRQILGWREFIRGMYWLDMPGMKAANHYGHTRPLPGWYWTGQTRMACMGAVVGQTLQHGYAHHIQRLMVTGQFALLAGLSPQAVADWYLAMYVDAVEWVELPNTAGMALFANGGRFTSKPYVASGQYIDRMSNYCSGCRYRPAVRTGPDACPMTTLYWAFLDRHEEVLQGNPRTALMVRNLVRLDDAARAAIRAEAAQVLQRLDSL